MTDHHSEKAKYEKAWSDDAYRVWSPGACNVWSFRDLAAPLPGSSILDIGAGSGRAALWFKRAGFKVAMVDIADNCLDDDVQAEIGGSLTIGNLWDPHLNQRLPLFDYGYCCDVMEHIPREHVDAVIRFALDRCAEVFFTISNQDDNFGEKIEEVLHLTVEPFAWWKAKMETFGEIKAARDMSGNSWFLVCRKSR